MKIAVYAIAKNEQEFARRWYESVIDSADELLVIDTGSTDDTVRLLTSLNVPVRKATVSPFRFDDARNIALNLLSDDVDIAISLDLDETLTEGWREKIEAAWVEGTTRLHYKYVWSWMKENPSVPDQMFYSDKISGRHTHRWKNPVHEILYPTVPEINAVCHDILIYHRPDDKKSRSNYLNLLELSVREEPFNDRNSHYLGREYYYHQNYEQAIKEFQRHITLPTAQWPAEKAASFRYGAKCFEALGDLTKAYQWFTLATVEDLHSREAMVDMASFLLRQKDWQGTLYYATRALGIPTDQSNYINERYALFEGPFDLAAVAFHYLGNKKDALECAKKAIELNPHDDRLKDNLSLIEGTSRSKRRVL